MNWRTDELVLTLQRIRDRITECEKQNTLMSANLITLKKEMNREAVEITDKEEYQEKEAPMGYSQWKEHGMKYGYLLCYDTLKKLTISNCDKS